MKVEFQALVFEEVHGRNPEIRTWKSESQEEVWWTLA
jgi:hypothetical protein